jgi:hypothetical protein
MSEQEQAPEQIADDAAREALAEMDRADPSNALEQGSVEDDVVTTLAAGVGDALASGLNKPAGVYAEMIASELDFYTKTDVKQKIKDAAEAARQEYDNKTPLDEYLRGNLQSVTVHNTTDAKQGAHYTWDFGRFQVQTKSGRDRRAHFSWQNFRDMMLESGGVDVAKPDKELRGGSDWRDFITKLLDERGETVTVTGKRTEAVGQLQNEIRRKQAYGTAAGALEYTGVWLIIDTVDLPEWWSVFSDLSARDDRGIDESVIREVRLHESLVGPAVEDTEITRAALYQELSARGHTIPGAGGPSMKEYVNGTMERFWTLRPTIATPAAYIPDPHAGKVGPVGIEWADRPGEEPADDEQEATTAGTDHDDDDDGGASSGFSSVGDA